MPEIADSTHIDKLDAAQQSELVRVLKHRSLDAVVLVDAASRVWFWNRAATDLFGVDEESIFGIDLHDVITPERFRDEARAGFGHFQETGQGPLVGKITEVVACRANGDEFPVDLAIDGIEIGGELCALGILRDATERDATRGRIEAQRDQLADLNAMKDRLFGIVAHDLKSPLHALLLQTRALAEDVDSMSRDEIRRHAVAVQELAERMHALSSDLLDWAGYRLADTPSREAIDLRDVVDKVREDLAGRAADKDVTIVVRGERTTATTDARALATVVRNLAENAVKYARAETEVVFAIEVEAGAEDRITLSFLNRGDPIPIDRLDALRAGRPVQSTVGTAGERGSGLGLCLASSIADDLGCPLDWRVGDDSIVATIGIDRAL